jgi:hypothetical protein
MKKGSFRRLLYLVQMAATIGGLAACGSDIARESRMPQATDAHELKSDPLADAAPSTMAELQHFDAYEYYRDVIDLHGVVSAAASGLVKANGGDSGVLSCFRSRAFK